MNFLINTFLYSAASLKLYRIRGMSMSWNYVTSGNIISFKILCRNVPQSIYPL